MGLSPPAVGGSVPVQTITDNGSLYGMEHPSERCGQRFRTSHRENRGVQALVTARVRWHHAAKWLGTPGMGLLDGGGLTGPIRFTAVARMGPIGRSDTCRAARRSTRESPPRRRNA